MAAKTIGKPFTKDTAKLAGTIGRTARWGLKPTGALIARDMSAIESRQPGGLERESKIVRGELAAIVRHCVGLIANNPPRRLKQLGNTPDGEGIVSVVARLSDTSSTIFGWDADKGNSIVLIGLVSSMDPEQPVQSSVDVEEVKPS